MKKLAERFSASQNSTADPKIEKATYFTSGIFCRTTCGK
jgi:hypothetical protein